MFPEDPDRFDDPDDSDDPDNPDNYDTAELIEPSDEGRKQLISSSLVEVDLAALSHRGHVRLNNEDQFYVGRAIRDLQTMMTSVPATEIPDRFGEVAYGMIVADGMGGQAAGEVASQLAIGTFVQLVLETSDWILGAKYGDPERTMRRMAERFRKIHDVIEARSEQEYLLAGMGTTMTLACSLGRMLIITHVGDSRAYLFRNGVLEQLTRDHTLAQKLADAGLIAPEEVDTHAARHILTEAIGAGQRAEADVRRIELQDGDDVLLCTDGLTGMIGDDAIAEILRRKKSSEEVCQLLVKAALDRGGRDNVTVVLARYRIPVNV